MAPRIYVNADLTRVQRDQLKRLKTELRVRLDAGEVRLVGTRIVPVRE